MFSGILFNPECCHSLVWVTPETVKFTITWLPTVRKARTDVIIQTFTKIYNRALILLKRPFMVYTWRTNVHECCVYLCLFMCFHNQVWFCITDVKVLSNVASHAREFPFTITLELARRLWWLWPVERMHFFNTFIISTFISCCILTEYLNNLLPCIDKPNHRYITVNKVPNTLNTTLHLSHDQWNLHLIHLSNILLNIHK